MIVLIFGQPNSGKTTLAQSLIASMKKRFAWHNVHNVDGDSVRNLYADNDFSKEGRINNLKRISDISLYINKAKYDTTIISSVYPYEQSREYLRQLCLRSDVPFLSVYLTYDEPRGREVYHVKDFEVPTIDEDVITFNTDLVELKECIDILLIKITNARNYRSSLT